MTKKPDPCGCQARREWLDRQAVKMAKAAAQTLDDLRRLLGRMGRGGH